MGGGNPQPSSYIPYICSFYSPWGFRHWKPSLYSTTSSAIYPFRRVILDSTVLRIWFSLYLIKKERKKNIMIACGGSGDVHLRTFNCFSTVKWLVSLFPSRFFAAEFGVSSDLVWPDWYRSTLRGQVLLPRGYSLLVRTLRKIQEDIKTNV
jgi:hypothetical protein